MNDIRRACDARKKESASQLWWVWTLSCGIGEFLGMAVAAGLAALSALLFGEPETLATRIASLLTMVLAGVLEGTSIGFFQWRVLNRVFPKLSLRAWLTPTIIVAAVGWFIGMLPPTLLRNAEGGEAIPEPSPLMMIIFAAVFGAVAGVVFGFAQWLVLRRQTKQGAIWILVNATGWALAMSVIYLGASLPTAEWPIAAVVVDGAVTGIVAGLFWALIVIRTPMEEKKLIEEFGEEYRQYMRRVGQFVPKLRRPVSYG